MEVVEEQRGGAEASRTHTGVKRLLPPPCQAGAAADSNSSKTGTGATTSGMEWSASSPCTSQATTRCGRKRRRANLNEPMGSLDLDMSKPTAMVLASGGGFKMGAAVEGCNAVVLAQPQQQGAIAISQAPALSLVPLLPLQHGETVKKVEKRVVVMFRELDLLLQAERINRRVMYRWSGAEKTSVPLDENSTSYCTWGRELVKQAVEDAITDIREAMALAEDYASCAEAGRRLIHMYVSKASERLILENERPLHDEVMSNMGNLWFALLPKIPQEEREQFQRLMTRILRAGGSLVAAFRVALELSKLQLWDHDAPQMVEVSPESGDVMGAEEEEKETPEEQLGRILAHDDLYRCEAYTCLWEVANVLANRTNEASNRLLCQEVRLKALDAEMWRAMLMEEQESRHKAEEMDDWDEEEDDDDDEEEEVEEEMAAVLEGAGHGQGEAMEGSVKNDIVSGMGSVTAGEGRSRHVASPMASPPAAVGKAGAQVQAVAQEGAVSQYSSFRRSSEGGEEVHAERWASKAALEVPEQELYIDYLSRRQHEYRRVMTSDFRARLMLFVQDCEPVSGATCTDESADPFQLLLNRARPFLARVASVLPTEHLSSYLDLLASKIGYPSTLALLEPIIVHEHEAYSSARVSEALSWAVTFDNGQQLTTFQEQYLPILSSRTELRQAALQAVVYGPTSFPLIDRALGSVPRQDYDNVAVELSRLAAESWMARGFAGAHLVVLRVLQRMPSLRLYLRCRTHFPEPVAQLLRPLLQHLDPTGELSIGIRLVEGMVNSAVASIARSLDTTGPVPRKDRAQRWIDFAFAGVRGGQFPPCLIEKLCAHPTFMPCALGPAEGERDFVQGMVTLLGRLTELAHSHPRVVGGPCRRMLAHYEAIATNMSCGMDSSVVAAGEGILRAVGEFLEPPSQQEVVRA